MSIDDVDGMSYEQVRSGLVEVGSDEDMVVAHSTSLLVLKRRKRLLFIETILDGSHQS